MNDGSFWNISSVTKSTIQRANLTMSSSSEETGQDVQNENMKVFCRLRPMNKLEMSRRSKNCVDLPDDDPQCLTIDSPLEGEYDFFFDHVFEEYASQDEVYESSIAPVPEKLLEGYNCTVIAYGQTGSGKSHTIMGQNGGAEGLLALTQQPENGQPRRVNPEAQGMILRTTHDIFRQIQQAPASTEFTIRCSYVEIYLEKILDLLNPGGNEKLRIVETFAGDEAAGVGEDAGGVVISGAAELCCFDEADVFGLLARGNACRTMSSTEMNTDSSRSHAIFIMKVEQHDKKTGTITTSELQMIDLAGSEMASSQTAAVAQRDASAVQMEAKMINKSLTVLQNCIRAQLENQEEDTKHTVSKMCKQSNLTRFLRPSFGGNCKTWLILTASPSSYNIGETISTVKFGQHVAKIKNHAVVNADFSREVYRKRFMESEQERKDQMAVLRAIARECKTLKDNTRGGSFDKGDHDGPLWDTIEELLAADGDSDEEVDFKTLIQVRKHASDGASLDSPIDEENEVEKARLEIEQLREELESITKSRDEADSQLSELQSEVAVLRSQNEHLISDKTKDLEELINAKNELQIMSQRKIEVEHNFRTSQFRENEAIVFLRTFRRFYKNVLRDRAAQGSGSISAITKEIMDKVPGAISLDELVDADKLLLEAGLIEEHEMRDEKSAPVYVPSKDALIRSATAAKKASKELGALEKKLEKEKAKEQRRQSLEREDSGSNFTAPAAPGRNVVSRRRGSAIRRSSFASLDQAISNEDEEATNGDTVETIDDPKANAEQASKAPGAGADAGAGSSQPAGKSGGDAVAALFLWDQSGTAVTKRQQLLGTPAGRFSIMHDKKMHEEFEDMADQCIKLERALKEERATVEMLSGRAGGVNKKKLAQEAIQLRQQIERKTNNLMAIAWKMNELNLINKSYNEKMTNREQHVVYLEENYVELQNRNRMIIEEQQEAERKLREEFNSVQKVLGGMSVSLWQYQEEKLSEERSLASRIHVPVLGGSQLEDTPRERRLSEAESEPSVDEFQVRRESEQVDASTQTAVVTKEDFGAQTDGIHCEDVGIMTEESLGTAVLAGPSTDSEDAVVDTVDVGVQTEKQETVNDVTAVGADEATAAVATAAAATSSISYAQDEQSASSEGSDDTSNNRSASDLLRAAAGTAAVVSIPARMDDDSSAAESESADEADLFDKVPESDARDVTTEATSPVPSRTADVRAEDSYETDSDDETGDASVSSATSSASAKSASSPDDDGDQSEESEVRSRRNEMMDDLTSSDGSNDSPTGQTSAHQNDPIASDDDIETVTNELASDGVVPRKISVSSKDDSEAKDEELSASPPWKSGMIATTGITGAAVVAAAASISRETEEDETKESEPLINDDSGKSRESAPEKAKNLFAATVFSVLNIGSNDAAKKKEEVKTQETEIESYDGDGHTPNTNFRGDREELAASSRDEWAAARDDFDSIFEETAQAVSSASSRRRPIPEEDPERSTREFMDVAAKIGHKGEDEIVTMGSKGKVWSDERHTVEESRKPWEKGPGADNRKPWEKAGKRGMDDGSLDSFDATRDDWYGGGGSDDESDGSYQFETHVLNRPKKKEVSRSQGTTVKFTNSTKRSSMSEDDEFDKMMNATQAALGAAEVSATPDQEVENDPATDTVSLTSREEAMFTGGRPNDFQPLRQAKRPKIRAGVMKEEKKSSRDKGRSQLLRRKSDSRRKVGDDGSKKKKKKDEKKKKKSSSKSTRDLTRAKSERYPRNGNKKDKELTRSPRRKSAGG